MKHILLASFLLVACSGVIETYNPGPSPLLRKAFEQRLSKEGIKFTVDNRGYYSTSSQDYQRMTIIGKEVNSLIGGTTYLPADEECPTKRMQTFLEEQNILFVRGDFEGKPKFHVTTADFNQHKLINVHASFVFACEKSQ